jgi:hypothetical protein
MNDLTKEEWRNVKEDQKIQTLALYECGMLDKPEFGAWAKQDDIDIHTYSGVDRVCSQNNRKQYTLLCYLKSWMSNGREPCFGLSWEAKTIMIY